MYIFWITIVILNSVFFVTLIFFFCVLKVYNILFFYIIHTDLSNIILFWNSRSFFHFNIVEGVCPSLFHLIHAILQEVFHFRHIFIDLDNIFNIFWASLFLFVETMFPPVLNTHSDLPEEAGIALNSSEVTQKLVW